jgi:hypothetical protein
MVSSIHNNSPSKDRAIDGEDKHAPLAAADRNSEISEGWETCAAELARNTTENTTCSHDAVERDRSTMT